MKIPFWHPCVVVGYWKSTTGVKNNKIHTDFIYLHNSEHLFLWPLPSYTYTHTSTFLPPHKSNRKNFFSCKTRLENIFSCSSCSILCILIPKRFFTLKEMQFSHSLVQKNTEKHLFQRHPCRVVEKKPMGQCTSRHHHWRLFLWSQIHHMLPDFSTAGCTQTNSIKILYFDNKFLILELLHWHINTGFNS